MTTENKQSELQRHRAILLATLDYLQERFGESFVYDQYDPVLEYYIQQKVQIEKYFTQRRLDRLKQRFAMLTKELQFGADMNFNLYIKEKTGYNIDIFKDLRKRIEAIKSQNKILSEKELNDISTMLRIYNEIPGNGEEVKKLDILLNEYAKRISEGFHKRKDEHHQVISRVVEDDLEEVTVTISTGPKPKHFVKQEATCPKMLAVIVLKAIEM